MRNLFVLTLVFLLGPFLLGGCGGLLGDLMRARDVNMTPGGYKVPDGGQTARAALTRLYVHNQCYAPIWVEFPERKNRLYFVPDRSIGSVWTSKKGALPQTVISRKDVSENLVYSPERIRKEARRDEWRLSTALVESYYLTTCPREAPLGDDEGNQVRPAKAGERVDVYTLSMPEYSDEPVRINLNGKRVRFLSTDKKGEASFLLPAGTTGELSIISRLNTSFVRGAIKTNAPSTYTIGRDWKPSKTRPAKAGEWIVAEPQPLTAKGTWE